MFMALHVLLLLTPSKLYLRVSESRVSESSKLLRTSYQEVMDLSHIMDRQQQSTTR